MLEYRSIFGALDSGHIGLMGYCSNQQWDKSTQETVVAIGHSPAIADWIIYRYYLR